MCLGGPLIPRPVAEHEGGEDQQPNKQQTGGTDIDLLHILGSSGEGVSTVIIFVVTVLLLSLWFLWKCIKECNRGSDNKHDLPKTCKYEQKFLMLLEKQDREPCRIAELEERFELQADSLRTDKARILQGQHYQSVPAHLRERNQLKQIKRDSGSDALSAGDSTPLMRFLLLFLLLLGVPWG